jgi:hypothetical protein
MLTKSSLFISVFVIGLTLPAFSAAPLDPNMPRAGLYKWEMKTDSQHETANTNIKTKSDETGATTYKASSNGKEYNRQYAGGKPAERCIDYSKMSGAGMQKMANCKAGTPVKTATSTKTSSVCNGMTVTVENKKISDDVYEVSSEVDMRGSKHKSVTVMTRVGDCKL